MRTPKEKIKANLFKVLTRIALASILLTACEGGVAATLALVEKVKVVIFVGMGSGTDPDQMEAENKLAQKFNATHDNIEIEFLFVPYGEATTRYLAMLSGGDAPQLVGPTGIGSVAQFFDTWEDITPYIKAENYDLTDFYGPTIELNQYPDKNIGLPLGLYPSFIYYNEDLFDAAGVDYPTHDFADTSWNMDKLRETAMKLTLDKSGKNATDPGFDPANIVQYGYDDSWEGLSGTLAMWGAENVGRPTTADYKTATVNSPEWIQGLQWLSHGIWKDHFIGSAEVQAERASTGVNPFGAGMTGMFYSHSWFMPAGLRDTSFSADIAPFPYNPKGQRIARIDADSFNIPKDAKHKQEAWEVMKWLTSPEIIVEVCRIYGCIPARQSVESQFVEQLKSSYPGIDYDVIFKSINYLDHPNNEAWIPESGKIHDALDYALSLIYSGEEKDAKHVLNDANAEVQKILDEYWSAHK